MGSTGFLKISRSEFRRVVEEGARWCIQHGYGWEEDLERTEESGCIAGANSAMISEKAIDRGFHQIGTLGSGNHYLEIQVARRENIFDERLARVFGISIPDQVVVMFHCGSRGFGHQVATADIAFEAWGEDLEETFVSAADATMNVMVEELNAIQPLERREFRLENEELDLLLFNLLQELIYYKDAEKLMLRVNQARVQAEARPYVLEAIAWGETLDPDRHHPRVDVKAVTLHQFRLERTDRGWKASVILDI